MRDIKFFLFLIAISIVLFSCKSTKIQDTVEPAQDLTEIQNPVSEQIPEEPVPSSKETEDTTEESIEETIIESYDSDDEVILVDEVISEADDDEYLRSTNDLSSEDSVTKEEFEEDKATILEIISELTEIMEKNDVKAWLSYISPESINYYSNPTNIRKAQKKLPDKTIQLHGIGDYFKYVFIPARKRSNVDEIRYISKTNVKAVQVKADNSIVVYYYFIKIDGKWMVHIPPLP